MNYLSCRLLAALVLLAGVAGAFVPGNARAETYHTCAGFIDSLPATITRQGTWCLRKDLSTSITSGNAITIANNNVTIDCNDFKVGGLAAGDGSAAIGVYAYSRQNATVRNCNVRGFLYGIWLSNGNTQTGTGAGHLVEDNRLDNNLYIGIQVDGDNGRVRRNAVYDTGSGIFAQTYGIVSAGDAIDNTVAGMFSTAANASSNGIYISGVGSVARNNRVRGLGASGNGRAYGIWANDAGTTVEGNQVIVPSGTPGVGIEGEDANATACSNNVVAGFNTAMQYCADAGNNIVLSL